jgi:hypothetical protein
MLGGTLLKFGYNSMAGVVMNEDYRLGTAARLKSFRRGRVEYASDLRLF